METGPGYITTFHYSVKHVAFGIRYFNEPQTQPRFFFRATTDQCSGASTVATIHKAVAGRLFGNFNLTTRRWFKLDEGFIGGEMQFLNYWSMFMGTGRFKRAYDDLDTRGGPPIVRPANWWIDSFFNTDSRKPYRFGAGNFFNFTEEGGWNRSHRVNLTLQPRPALQGTIGLEYTSAHDEAQWIENTDVTGDGVDDHIYGTLKRNVVSIPRARSTRSRAT